MTIRAFVEPDALSGLSPGDALTLSADESHYLARVRRCRVGQQVELLDGVASSWSATIAELSPAVRVHAVTARTPRIAPDVRLLVAIIDPAPTLRVIEQANELGARELVLVTCARSQGRIPRLDRIERVLRSSCRQCGRARPLRVRGPLSFDDALDGGEHGTAVIAWAGEPRSPRPWPPASAVTALVGPEGGFTESELERARQAGFRVEGLGAWILRTETAAIASLTLALSSVVP